jgi:hypothetical protein
MYEYITSQSNIVQLSIDILYMPKANGSMKGMMPIIKRMFQIRFFFMGFSKIERCKADLLNNFIQQGVTEINTSLQSGSIDSVQTVGRGAARLKHGSEG